MAEYYTKPESDARYATLNHTHNLEDLSGAELPANRIEVPAGVSAAFDNAFTLDEALESIADQLGDASAPDLSGYATTAAMTAALAGKSNTNHTHTLASIGAAAADHSHNYAAPTHNHAQSEISGLTDALAGKANVSAMSGKADLVDGKVPAAQLPSFVDDVLEYAAVSNFPATGEAGKIYVATGTNKSYRWGGSNYVEIAGGVALGETSGTAYRGDRGKTAYDHSQNAEIHVTAAQKTAWDGKAAGNHTHTPASIGAAAASHSHNYADPDHTHAYSELTGLPTIPTIPSSLPANGGNADTVDGKHAADFATAGHTHSGFAASGHTHTAAALLAMAGALFGTNEIGGAEYSYGSGATSNLLTTMAAWPQGLHTAYVIAGTNGAPPAPGESWRIIAHKTSDTIGWILAFGSSGSIFANYQNTATTFRGWRAIYEAAPAPLWTGGANGGYYMTEGHTITPTKKLSECRNGWILLWSDYDSGANAQANNTDFCTTIIPKRAYTGQLWNGAMWYCDVPAYAAGTATDSENRVIKVLQVYDAKLVGTSNNAAAPRNDVVLRAVYEF